MLIFELLNDKNLKAKQKTAALADALLTKKIAPAELIEVARKVNESDRATCLEALEKATKTQVDLADEAVFAFCCACLTEKAPRVKWESARVIGNVAALFRTKIDAAVGPLLQNTEHDGTVVRWSAAYALGEILKMKTPLNDDLAPAIEGILERETDGAIQKIYAAALKKAKK